MIRLALGTRHRLTSNIKTSITYTRNYFEDLNIDRQSIERNRIKQEQAKHKQNILAVACNDKNPNNYIKKLKIDHKAYEHLDKMKAKTQVNECAILTPEPKKAPVQFSAIRKYVLTTLKKATLAMKIVRKRYLYDAILHLQQSPKKVCKLMLPTFFNCVRHAKDKGLDPLRLFVHGVIIGKTMRFKGLRYHAKGKSGRENKTLCQIKVIITERDEKEFWQQVGAGEAPGGFANIARDRLLSINANYNDLVNLSCVTTAKGRQQKREIIRRRIAVAMTQNEKNNTYIPKKVIQKKIRQEQGEKIKQIYKNLPVPEYISTIQKRQKLYKKNMGIE